ncbi:MAG: type VI secretion system ATPase TssH [Xanthomonadales bacterium]|nr:type VI secretion system ATPase TssH [Xanthomonadales bacterium]
MTEISRVALFGKLNSLCYKAIESATVFCKMRGNPYVELSHWLHQILQLNDSDLHRIVQHFELNPSHLARDFSESLDRLPRGATSISDLSSHLEEAVERGWVYATLMFGDSRVRSGYLFVGILKTPSLRNALVPISGEFSKLSADELSHRFDEICGGSPEEAMAANDGSEVGGGVAPGEASSAMAPAQMGKQEALQQFSVDLTERARQGEVDNIVGRDSEIRQIIDILMRRRQNNPILTGEAGVGKTAAVEGFALRIARGDVPPPLQGVTLRTLDVGLMQAGASMKGEFENRLKMVIEEVQSSPTPIILFIDEAHTLIGAGGEAGTGDAANLLKPELARGTLRTIAATTWAEYKKHIEKDPALTRRFQVVQIDEPSEDRAIQMMRSIAPAMEQHHRVLIMDEALEASVQLSHRYIPARQLPDKSVTLLDTAAARVATGLFAEPAEVENSRRRIEALETELSILERESDLGLDVGSRRDSVEGELATETEQLGELRTRWDSEKNLVEEILALRAKLHPEEADEGEAGEAAEPSPTEDQTTAEGDSSPRSDEDGAVEPAPTGETATEEQLDRPALLEQLRGCQDKLEEIQGEHPLMYPCVDGQSIATIVGEWTGIPVGRMVKNEIEAVLKLAGTMGQRVIGQDHALEMIAKRIQTSRAKLDNPNKPIGVFLLAGPSGVGKTETALTLAETLYGGEQNVVTINMSEFQEAHTVSTLKGAPPGYVGYGEGGILTEAVRRKPYSVVLLDEVEKAHPDVHEIFFQVFDKGAMEDGEGRMIDFKNTIILLTSNVGSDLIMNMCKDPELMPSTEGLAKSLREPLLQVFPAALLGRLVVIPFFPLNDEVIARIAGLQLGRISDRISDNWGVDFNYSDDVVRHIVERCTELESGGRMIDAILTNTLLPEASRGLLERQLSGEPVQGISVDIKDGEFDYRFGD